MPTRKSIEATKLDPTLETRVCTRCEHKGPKEDFGKGSHKFRCYSCNRELHQEWKAKDPEKTRLQQRDWALRKHYGIDSAHYEAMLVSQCGQCGICGTTDTNERYPYFDVDHDHSTGTIRGLLCSNCNRHLGWLEKVSHNSVGIYLGAP